ncbi:MAG: DUF1934 family protein [Lactobacillus sp.]
MTASKFDLTSIMTQAGETATSHVQGTGHWEQRESELRIAYLEADEIPVKMLLTAEKLIIRRGVDHQNYSLLRLNLHGQEACQYRVQGREMALTSQTHQLTFEVKAGKQQLQVEYDLFSGLYLIGNYAITLIFT